jgi:hypothetical protein
VPVFVELLRALLQFVDFSRDRQSRLVDDSCPGRSPIQQLKIP